MYVFHQVEWLWSLSTCHIDSNMGKREYDGLTNWPSVFTSCRFIAGNN